VFFASNPTKYSFNKENIVNYISVDDFRIQGEKVMLYGSLCVTLVVLLFLLGVSLPVILVMVAISIGYVKIRQGSLLGGGIKVSESQFPEIYNLAKIAAERLCMTIPDVFLIQSPVINAYALGFLGKKSVMLHTATVESMEQDELLSIIGHELTHIKAHHTNWLVITGSANESITIPIVSQVLSFVFLFWSRKAEYTCDRGGLIACRNLQASINSLAKLAIGKEMFNKLSMEDLLAQKRHIEEDEISKFAEKFQGHPYLINRMHALQKFATSDSYQNLLKTV
jgi:Zn-dependent protease with chaperone function